MKRREFLLGGASLFLLASPLSKALSTGLTLANSSAVLTSGIKENGKYFIVGVNLNGKLEFKFPLEHRVHGSVSSSTHHIFIDRRPGNNIHLITKENGRWIHKTTECDTNRHFYGHACFDKTQSYLYATENDLETGKGKIGVYSVSNHFKKIDEIESFGIGPHEVTLLPETNTIAVCNGGLKTHPSTGRETLNYDTMAPNLTYIDIQSKKNLGSYKLENSKLSIRHMTVNKEGRIFFGVQDQDYDAFEPAPLVYTHKLGEKNITEFNAPLKIRRKMKGYTASLAVSDQTLVVTAPKGNLITFWDIQTKKLIKTHQSNDTAGVSYNHYGKNFICSTGDGHLEIHHEESNNKDYQSLYSLNASFDNHLVLS